MKKARYLGALGLGPDRAFFSSGCVPFSAGILDADSGPPWVTERMEDKYGNRTTSRRRCCLRSRKARFPSVEDAPDDARVLRAMPHVARGVPYFYEEFRDDISIVKERIKDVVDPPRFFPSLGPASCTIATGSVRSSIPRRFPRTIRSRSGPSSPGLRCSISTWITCICSARHAGDAPELWPGPRRPLITS